MSADTAICDYDMTFAQLEAKYGKLTLKDGNWVDRTNRIRRINHSMANGDFLNEMQDGRLFHSPDDDKLTLVELTKKYGPLRLTEQNYYVDNAGNIRRIMPYTPLVR